MRTGLSREAARSALGDESIVKRAQFVIQEHHASHLHWDFRLEMGGVLKSWAVPKGPSLDPAVKRLAVEVGDHAVSYLTFTGEISEGHYGAGLVYRWDIGTFEMTEGDALEDWRTGSLRFRLHGERLKGEWRLFRMKGRKEKGKPLWLLQKVEDEFARSDWKLEPLAGGERQEAEAGKKLVSASGARGREEKASARKIKSEKRAEERAVPASRAFKSGELAGDLSVKVNGHAVALTHLDKVFWPDEGYTKGDLIKYYDEVAPYILPYLKDRPLIMKRYPNGIEGSYFHQHNVDEAPAYVRTARLEVEEGHEVDYIIGGNRATLLYMANLGAIERHPWHSRVRNLDRPDWFVFDLDPQGVTWEEICEVAVSCKEILDRLGLDSYPKTSGSRGIHVYVPIKPVYSYAEVADFALGVATLVERANPTVATLERSLKKRKQARIYVDHMQNARGKSVAAPYSVRPKPGATVSAPLEWGEVTGRQVTIADFTIKNMLERLRRKGDLFKEVLGNRQSLNRAIEKLNDLTGKSKARRARA